MWTSWGLRNWGRSGVCHCVIVSDPRPSLDKLEYSNSVLLLTLLCTQDAKLQDQYAKIKDAQQRIAEATGKPAKDEDVAYALGGEMQLTGSEARGFSAVHWQGALGRLFCCSHGGLRLVVV